MTMSVDGTNGITFPNGSVQLVAALTATQSMIRMSLANGYGTTNTNIRRFTNVAVTQGTDITYSDSTTLGASFTINTTGVYAIVYVDQFTGAAYMGLSLNTTHPTASITTFLPPEQLAAVVSSTTANYANSASSTLYLTSGSVIRAHTDASASGTMTGACQFTITRVS